MGCLYMLEFASGKRYIGLTERTLRRRLVGHRAALKSGSSLAVHNAWRKHGKPIVRTLVNGTGEYLRDLEKRAIVAYNTLSPNGYNILPDAGSSPAIVVRGRRFTKDHCAKISAALTGYVRTAEHSSNLAAALSAKKKGKPLSEAHRAAIRAGMASPEVRKKISDARMAACL